MSTADSSYTPPEQQALAEEIEELLDGRARLEAELTAPLRRVGALRRVPQDSDDEPASILLDRIRAERTAAENGARGRRRRVGASPT